MKLTTADLTRVELAYCQLSLANFAKRAWHVLEPTTPLKWGWALDAICEHLEAVSSGEIKRLLINVPPGSMKSLLASVIWPAWEWGPRGRPELRYLGTAHKQDLAVRDSTKCRRLIQSTWYQEICPITLTGDQNQKTKFENTSTGFREAMAFSSLTGSRADRIVCDDLHSVDDANSRVKLASDIVTFREALPSRVNNDQSAIVIIMQRLAVGDVSDVAIELGYDYLKIPMRYELGMSRHAVGKPDPRTQAGELMFPERFTEAAVSELEHSLGSFATAGQLQQRPNPRGGRLIKTEWFGMVSVLPILTHRVIYADTAMKLATHNDFSVLATFGKGKDGKLYLLDLLRGKFEAPELERRTIAYWSKHLALETTLLGQLRHLKIEDKSSGTGLIQSIRHKGGIPVQAVQVAKDKFTRVADVLGYIEAGLVCLPEGAPWVNDFLAECESFSADNTHAHDDQVDVLSMAITDMLASNVVSIWESIA